MPIWRKTLLVKSVNQSGRLIHQCFCLLLFCCRPFGAIFWTTWEMHSTPTLPPPPKHIHTSTHTSPHLHPTPKLHKASWYQDILLWIRQHHLIKECQTVDIAVLAQTFFMCYMYCMLNAWDRHVFVYFLILLWSLFCLLFYFLSLLSLMQLPCTVSFFCLKGKAAPWIKCIAHRPYCSSPSLSIAPPVHGNASSLSLEIPWWSQEMGPSGTNRLGYSRTVKEWAVHLLWIQLDALWFLYIGCCPRASRYCMVQPHRASRSCYIDLKAEPSCHPRQRHYYHNRHNWMEERMDGNISLWAMERHECQRRSSIDWGRPSIEWPETKVWCWG